MSDNITLQRITTLDGGAAEQLSRLLIHVVEDGASVGFLPPLSREEAEGYWQQVIADDVQLWAAIQGECIIGTVQLHLAMKANALHRAEIAKLMVDPSSRRGGIGRKLMHTAEQAAFCEGRSLLVLDTRSGDPSNLLYRSIGYIEAGHIPHYARSANGELDGTTLYYKLLAHDKNGVKE
ncbi:GNAT family N-acetyltransferase [Paenibacillus pinihumi]|uniref:GNAT family N-acetyltransferase n=1 Tax=Paenibacillus pinihumi TaxID=669462 RepID=UPI000411984E|nr:GNAT family N-acetyltransferase [Paenibacillus pinihumi]